VKKQKFDREDARLLLRLLRENNFPQIWVPDPENRDLRQLLWHRHRLVQMRTRIMNQLQALAMNEGYRWKKKLFSEPGRAQLEKLALAPWASRRRQELLELLDRMNPTIEELTAAVEREARKRPEALRLMTHPGVGPLTALAYVLIIGTPTRFQRGKQIGTYVGMIPCEESSARKQRLGHIGKQGSSLLRFLLVEAAPAAARLHPDWRCRYVHLAMRRHKGIAKVAMGHKLAVRLYWMWRNGCEYWPSFEFGSYAGAVRNRKRREVERRPCDQRALMPRLLIFVAFFGRIQWGFRWRSRDFGHCFFDRVTGVILRVGFIRGAMLGYLADHQLRVFTARQCTLREGPVVFRLT